MAQQYIVEHSGALAAAEDRYGVPREIITAIMLVETQLGTLVGNQSVFNILSTMAALDDPAVRKAFWQELPQERRLSHKAFEKKADRKSRWAYNELKALLRYVDAEKIRSGNHPGILCRCHGLLPVHAEQCPATGGGRQR
jgi:membrane-bound lytic murein transglycosylase B